MEHTMIYPEMGETTEAVIKYTTGYGGRLYLTTDLELKGRGIKKAGDGKNHKNGKKTYYATKLAFEKLKERYTTCYICLL